MGESVADLASEPVADPASEADQPKDTPLPGVSIALFLFWSFSSLLAYSIAGEKMPWLTVHITLAMILSTAWFLGRLVDSTNWTLVKQRRGIIVLLCLPVFLISSISAVVDAPGHKPSLPGQGAHPAPVYQHLPVRLDYRRVYRLGAAQALPRLGSWTALTPAHIGFLCTAGLSDCQSCHHGCLY